MQRVQRSLPPQPARGGAVTVLLLAEGVKLREIVLDRLAVGVGQQASWNPAHEQVELFIRLAELVLG